MYTSETLLMVDNPKSVTKLQMIGLQEHQKTEGGGMRD